MWVSWVKTQKREVAMAAMASIEHENNQRHILANAFPLGFAWNVQFYE